MTEAETQPVLVGGIGAGVGGGVGTVVDQFFATPFLANIAIAGTVGLLVAVGLFLVISG